MPVSGSMDVLAVVTTVVANVNLKNNGRHQWKGSKLAAAAILSFVVLVVIKQW